MPQDMPQYPVGRHTRHRTALWLAAACLAIAWDAPHMSTPTADIQPPRTLLTTPQADTERIATIQIGAQEWMAENLRTASYRNGDPIPEVRSTDQWTKTTAGAWCHYDNDTLNEKTYGKLYNWQAVQDPRGLCPAGWRVPDDADWNRLAEHLGGADKAGGHLKASIFWEPPNPRMPSPTAFDARPGGYRYDNGFYFAGTQGYWWTATPEDATFSWSRVMANRELTLHRISFDRMMGFSVRCIRDR